MIKSKQGGKKYKKQLLNFRLTREWPLTEIIITSNRCVTWFSYIGHCRIDLSGCAEV